MAAATFDQHPPVDVSAAMFPIEPSRQITWRGDCRARC